MSSSAFSLATWKEVQVQDITSAVSSVEFTTGIDSTGIAYLFVLETLVFSQGGKNTLMTTSADGGSTYASSGYERAMIRLVSGSTNSGVGSNAQTSMIVTANTAITSQAGASSCCRILLFNPANTTRYKHVLALSNAISSTAQLEGDTTCLTRDSASIIDAVKFAPSAGNFNTGRIACYKIV